MFDKMKGFKEGAAELFRETLSGVILESLKKKSIFIPEVAIEKGLRHKLSESDVELDELKCTDESIALQLSKRKFGANLRYSADIVIEALEISPKRHEAVFRIESDKLAGEKVWGYIVACLIELIVNDIVSSTISNTDISKVIEYDAGSRVARMDLRNIPGIDQLYQDRRMLFNRRIVDIIRVLRCDHKSGGVEIRTNTLLEIGDTQRTIEE